MGRALSTVNPISDSPTSIVNYFSTAGVATVVMAAPVAGYAQSGIASSLSGALTANTLATVLNITGSGVLNFLAASSVDTTARTHRLQIIIDGVTVFDPGASASTSTTNNGIIPVGGISVGALPNSVHIDQIPFKKSLVVKYASSVTETDKTNLLWKYRVN